MRVVSKADLHAAYRDVFTTPAGQVLLSDLVRHFGFTNRLTLGRDPHETYFNEGRRSVLIYIERVLTTDPNMTETAEEPDFDGRPDSGDPADDYSGADGI